VLLIAPVMWVRIAVNAACQRRSSPVSERVSALATVMICRHSGVAKFAARNPMSSRGASSCTP
jgi:hypothetical protein